MEEAPPRASRPILITGGGGRLARAFAAAAELRGLAHCNVTHAELDITQRAAVDATLRSSSPWAVINCAGFADVDVAEQQQSECLHVNADGAETVAGACAAAGIPLLTFSSDFVFDGLSRTPYNESDPVGALNAYGESKILAEENVRTAFPKALVLRLGKLLTPGDEHDFLWRNLNALTRGEGVTVPNDIEFSATFLPDLVHAALDLLIDDEHGIWHMTNDGVFTPETFLRAACDIAQLDAREIEGVPAWSLHRSALRPRFRALTSERGRLLPSASDALRRYVHAWIPSREEMNRLAAAL